MPHEIKPTRDRFVFMDEIIKCAREIQARHQYGALKEYAETLVRQGRNPTEIARTLNKFCEQIQRDLNDLGLGDKEMRREEYLLALEKLPK